MFTTGVLVNELITFNEPNYSLNGMINPTFQNDGTAKAYLGGRLIAPGESYNVFAPGVILTNKVSITFESDPTKTKKLYVGFVKTV